MEPVKGSNSLDAELGGCSMLIDSLKNLDAEMREVVKRSLRSNYIQFLFDFISVQYISCFSSHTLHPPFFLFFEKTYEINVSQDRCAKDSRKPVIPHHLCLRRDVVTEPQRLTTKKRLGKSLRCTASQHGAPSAQTSCRHAASEEFRH